MTVLEVLHLDTGNMATSGNSSATLGKVKCILTMWPRTPTLGCSFKWDEKLHRHKESALDWSWTPTQQRNKPLLCPIWINSNTYTKTEEPDAQTCGQPDSIDMAFWEKHNHHGYKQMHVYMGQEWDSLSWGIKRKPFGMMELLYVLTVLVHIFLFVSVEHITLKWLSFIIYKLSW